MFAAVMIRNISPLALPLAVLTATWFLLPSIPLIPPEKQELLTSAPYLLLAVGTALSFHFRRGRIFLILALIALSYFLFIFRLAGARGPVTPNSWLIFRAIAFLLPFNLALCSLMQEKGVLTKAGRMRLLFFGFQAVILWIMVRNDQQGLWMFLSRKIVVWPLLDHVHLPQGSLFLFLLGGVIALWRTFSRQSPIEGGVFGAIVACFALLNWMWTPDIPAAFSTAAAFILVIAVIQDSHDMAFRDDLTKLHSRRALNELLPSLGRRYAIAMVDVDHFKSFNDNYGHDVGDQVLKMIASKLMGVSGRGRPFRYGGEEFTVVFPGKGVKEAVPHLETLRKVIAGYQMYLRNDDRPKDDDRGKVRRSSRRSDSYVSVTISIGVAEAGNRLQTPEEVIKAADTALYKAKGNGRNQVCSAGPGR
jgi:GGDEF domain-containing protein